MEHLAELFLLQISVGRMHFSSKVNKGVIDRTFVPVKVARHKESSHADVLSKCISRYIM